jgi:iron complex outermembrane receptor protein
MRNLMLSSAIAGLVGGSIVLPAYAADRDATLEEVTVTARKTEESVQDVPLSVSALSRRDLEVRGIRGLSDVAANTPGLTFESFSGGALAAPTIRGLAQTNVTARENNVGTFLNGIYLANKSAIDIQLLDLQRVEVVKGPQSALFGRDSFAGSINYVTREPAVGGAAEARFTGGNDEYGEAFVSGSLPTLDPRLSTAFSVGYGTFDGTIRNVAAPGDRAEGYRRLTLSGTIRFQATEAFGIEVLAIHGKADNEPSAAFRVANNCGSRFDFARLRIGQTLYCGELPSQNFVDLDPRAPGSTTKTDVAALTLRYRFSDALQLVSVSSWQRSEFEDVANSDFSSKGSDYRVGVQGPAFTPLVPIRTIDVLTFGTSNGSGFVRDLQQELRLEGRPSDRVRWLAGAYLTRGKSEDRIDQALLTNAAVTGLPAGQTIASASQLRTDPIGAIRSGNALLNLSRFTDDTQAAFAMVEFGLGERARVAVEGRYTRNRRSADLIRQFGVPDTKPPAKRTYDYFTPRVTFDYRFSPNVMVYATGARGVKSGGFNVGQTTGNPAFDTFDSETNTTYEVGLKTSSDAARLTANLALFQTHWNNLVVNGLDATRGILVPLALNVSGARSRGAELQVAWRASDAWRFDAGYSFVDPTYNDDAVDAGPRFSCGTGSLPGTTLCRFNAAGNAIIGGNQIARTSRHQLAAGVSFEQPIGGEWRALARVDASYRSKQFTNSINLQSLPQQRNLNARIGVENDRYSISLWGRNLTDERYARSFTNFPAPDEFPIFTTLVFLNQARTYGVTLAARF